MIKTPHDVDATTIKKKATKAAAGAALVVLIAASASPAVSTSAMKMRHDCCVWTAPTK